MIDVIIPIHNEEEFIISVVDGLMLEPQVSKIILVLDRCTDNTEKFIDGIINTEGRIVKVVKNTSNYEGTFMKGLFVAEAINLGLSYRNLDSKFTMVLNADSILSKLYFQDALTIFKDKKVGLVGYADNANISGSGYIIRNTVLDKLGGKLVECGAEDTHLQFSIMNLGYDIKKLEYAFIIFKRKRGEKDKIKYEFSKGYSSYQLGFSFRYQILKFGYQLFKGNLLSFVIPFGFLYALFTTNRLSIAKSGMAKKWQNMRFKTVMNVI